MAWSEERKEKGRLTRERNRKAREAELEGLRQKIQDLTQMNEDLSKNLRALREEREMQHMVAPEPVPEIPPVASNLVDVEVHQFAELCARQTVGLLADALSVLAKTMTVVREESAEQEASPEPEKAATIVTPEVGNLDRFEGMSIQELNAEAIRLDLAPDYHRDRLINRIVEAQAK